MKEKRRRAGPRFPQARTVLRKAVAAVLTAGMIIPAVPASAKEAAPDTNIAQQYSSGSADSQELVVVNPDGKLKGKYGAGSTRTEGGMTYLTYGSHRKASEALSSIRKKGFSADYNVSFETAAGETKKKSAPDGDEATRGVTGKTRTVVAVIDTYIDRSDASLKGRIVRYDAEKKAFVKDDASGRTQKKNSHGTNMAEIVAKSTPDTVSIYPLEVFDDSGKGDSGRTAQAVSQAAREKADVILMSISGKGSSKALQQAVDAAREAGADVIAAAGNKSDSAGDYVPGSLDGVITAGALDRDGNPASYSNMGSEVDYSLSGTYVGNDGNEIKGTSVSAARLAGYAAAIRSAAGKGYADSVLAKASKDIGSSGTNPLTGELLYGRSVSAEDVVESLKSTEGLKAEQGAHKKKTYMDGKGIDLVSLAMEVAWVSAIGSAPKGSTKGDATFYIGYYYLGNGKIGTNAYTGSGYTKLTGWGGKSYHQYLSKEDKTPLHSAGPLAYRSLNEAMDEAATKDGYDISGWQDKMRAWGAWEDQSRHVDNAQYRGNKYGIWKRKENGEIQTVTFVSLSDLNISSKHFVNINMLDMDNGNREVSNGDLGTFDYTPTSTASGITYHYRNISNEPNDNNYPANSTGWISNITGKNGYVLDHIDVNGTRSSNGSYTVGSGNVVINIYMKRPQYKVNINMLDEENGNAERSDGSIGSFDYIARPANGDGTIPENAYSAYYRISNEPGNTNYYYSGSTGKIPRVYGANGYALDRIEVNGKRDGSTWDGEYTVSGADVQINIYMRKPRINISMLDADNNNKESFDGSLGTFDLKLSNGEGWTALSDQPAEIGTQRSGGGSHLSPGQIVYVSNIVPAKGYILKNVRGAKYIDGKWTYIVTDKSDKHFINLYMTRRTDLSFDPNGGMGDVQKSKRPAGSQVLANGGSSRFNGNIEKVDDTDSKSNPVTSIWTKFSYHRDAGRNDNTMIASNGFTKLYVDGAGRLAATVSTSSSNVGIQLTGSYLKQDTTYKVGLDMTDGKARLYVDGKSVAEKNLNGTLGTLHQLTDEEGTTKKYTKSNPATFNDRDNIYGLFTVHESHTYRLFVKAKRNRGTKPLKGGLWYHAYNGGGAAYDAYDMGGYQDGEWTNVGPAGDGYSIYYRDVTVPPGKSKARFYMQLEQQNNGDTSWSAYDMQVYEVRSTQSSSAQQNAVDTDASVSYDFIGGKLPVYTIGADVGENGRAGASEYFDSEDEGRAMSLDFLYYILTNPDVLKFYYPDYSSNVGIGAYNAGDWMKGAIAHFYRYGNQEGHASGMAFSAKEYASFYSDLFAASSSGKNGTWLAWHYGYYGIWEDPDRFGSDVMKDDAGQMNDAGNYVDINTIYFDQDKKHDDLMNGTFDRILYVRPAKDGQKYKGLMTVDGGDFDILPNGKIMPYTSLMMKGNGVLMRWDIKTPRRIGYEFEGWYTARSGGTRISESSATPSKATTYYAHWKAIPYQVSYNANGGKGSMPDSTAYYEKKFVTRKNAFTRKGYTFDGWKENDLGHYGRRWTLTTDGIWEYGNGSHPVVWDRPIGVTLYAQWKPNTYDVSYDANGGKFSGGTARIPTKAVYDSSYTVTSSVPSRDGYEFRGWAYNDRSNPKNMKFGSTAESGHHPKDSFIWQHDGNVTYYASWNRKPGLTIKDPPGKPDPSEPTDNPDDPAPHDTTTKLPPFIRKSSTSIIVQETYCRSSSTLLEYVTPFDNDGTATVHVDTIDGKPVGKDNNPGKWTATHHYLVQYTVTDDEGAKTIVTIDYYVNKTPALTALSRGFHLGSYVSRTELMKQTKATDYEDDRDGKKLTIRLWKVIYQDGHVQRPANDGTLDLDTSKEQKAYAFISVTDSMGATRYGAFQITIYPLDTTKGSRDDNYIRFTSEDAFLADGGSGFNSVMQGDLKSAFANQKSDTGDTSEIDLEKKAAVTLPDGTKKQMTYREYVNAVGIAEAARNRSLFTKKG